MAFPTLVNTNGGNAGNATSVTVNLPDGSNVSGRIIILELVCDATETFTYPSGWTSIGYRTSSAQTMEVVWHRTDGTEGYPATGATISVTISSSEASAHITYLFSGVHASSAPECHATGVLGGDESPNPPSYTASWGAEDNYWLACGSFNGQTVTVAPTNYTNLLTQQNGTGTAGATCYSAERQLNTSVQDPDIFTGTAIAQWFTFTAVIRPAAAAAFVAFQRLALSAILSAWQIVAPVDQPRPLIVQPAVVAEAPVLNTRPWLPSVLESWQDAPPVQQRRNQVVQGIQVDDPPPTRSLAQLAAIVESWQIPPDPAQRRASVVQAEAVNDPPFGQRLWISGTISAWETVPGPAQRRSSVVQAAVVNDPPFGQRTWLHGAVAAWEVVPYPAQRRPAAPVEVVNDPPFGQRLWLPGVLGSWRLDAPQFEQRKIVQPFVAADDPPFGSRPWLSGVISAWRLDVPQYQQRKIIQPFVAADNPSFGLRPWLPAVLGTWTPVDPVQQARRFVPQAVVNDPPFGQRLWLPGTLSTWESEPGQAQRRPVAIQVAVVNDPPFGIRPWLPSVIETWRKDPDVTAPRELLVQPAPPESFVTFGIITRNAVSPLIPTYFEVHLKTSDVLYAAQARLFNITDATIVPGSLATTTSLTVARIRSGPITMPVGAKEYRVEFGGMSGVGATYTIYSADWMPA